MKVPDALHPITVEPTASRVVVTVEGRVLADTTRALTLREAHYPPVQYVPREDVDMAQLERSDRKTYCPFKGQASYFSVGSAGERGVNAVWSYEDPYDAVGAIRGYLAFYPDRVDVVTDSPLHGRAARHGRH